MSTALRLPQLNSTSVQLNQRLLSTDYALDICEQKSQRDVVPALEKFTWEFGKWPSQYYLREEAVALLSLSCLCYAGYTAFVQETSAKEHLCSRDVTCSH